MRCRGPKAAEDKKKEVSALHMWGNIYHLGGLEDFYRAHRLNEKFSRLLDKEVSSSHYLAVILDETTKLGDLHPWPAGISVFFAVGHLRFLKGLWCRSSGWLLWEFGQQPDPVVTVSGQGCVLGSLLFQAEVSGDFCF